MVGITNSASGDQDHVPERPSSISREQSIEKECIKIEWRDRNGMSRNKIQGGMQRMVT